MALRWLLEQHLSGKGAFLADEMGLGKTIQAIALLVTLCETKMNDVKDMEQKNSSNIGPVLIVCPATVI